VYQRLHRENESKQRTLLQKQQEIQQQATKGCTFKPKINQRSDENSNPRLPAHERLYQRFEDRQRSKEAIPPLSDKRNQPSPAEPALLKRMKDFAERKKRNLIVIEQTVRTEQGLTFNPKINRAKNPRSRSTSA
jgi:hypothetical protein